MILINRGTLYTRSGRGRRCLAATSSSCLTLLVVQLLVEVALIDLEAGNVQRFGQRDVALDACCVCRRGVPQPSLRAQPFPCPTPPQAICFACGLCAFTGLSTPSPNSKRSKRILDFVRQQEDLIASDEGVATPYASCVSRRWDPSR
jgi:hypothetical protein